MHRKLILTLLFLWMVSSLGAGNLRGIVTITDENDPRNVVIYLDTTSGKKFPPPAKHAIMDQQGMRFVPHILPILVGTTVDFFNSDNYLHNIFSPDYTGGKFTLGTWAKGIIKSYTFNTPGSATLLCNVHPEMEAYIVVLSTPYFALSDSTGKYEIENVPPGTYWLKTWRELGDSTSQKIIIREKRPTIVHIKIK